MGSTGMSEKVWKKVNSLKPVKIWLLLRKITKKSAWTLWREKAKKEKNTKNFGSKSIAIFSEALDFRFFHFYFNRNHSVTFSFYLLLFLLLNCSMIILDKNITFPAIIFQ